MICSHDPKHQSADWAILDYHGDICDRFLTEEEAFEALAVGGYPGDVTVGMVDDPNPCGDEA